MLRTALAAWATLTVVCYVYSSCTYWAQGFWDNVMTGVILGALWTAVALALMATWMWALT